MPTGNDSPLHVPDDVHPGQPVSARDANQIRTALKQLDGEIRRRTPKPSATHGVRRSAGGFQIFHKEIDKQKDPVCGFFPVARGLGKDGDQQPGVGIVLGFVHTLHVIRIPVDGQPRVTTGLIPTLAGKSLDQDPPPRLHLEAGGHSAWLICEPFKAYIIFLERFEVPPSPGPWQRQIKLSEFDVQLPDDPEVPPIPTIKIYTQFVHCEVQLWIVGNPYLIGSESSSSSSSGSGSGGSGSGSSSGSSKDTAIVPASWTDGGYAALFTMEAPEVLFFDRVQIRPTGRRTRVKIDPRFLEVCERDSVEVYSVAPDRAAHVGARVEGDAVVLECARVRALRPRMVNVLVVGVRKGFPAEAGWRFPSKTREEFEANEAWLARNDPEEDEREQQ